MSFDIYLKPISYEIPQPSFQTFHRDVPGANEFKHPTQIIAFNKRLSLQEWMQFEQHYNVTPLFPYAFYTVHVSEWLCYNNLGASHFYWICFYIAVERFFYIPKYTCVSVRHCHGFEVCRYFYQMCYRHISIGNDCLVHPTRLITYSTKLAVATLDRFLLNLQLKSLLWYPICALYMLTMFGCIVCSFDSKKVLVTLAYRIRFGYIHFFLELRIYMAS